MKQLVRILVPRSLRNWLRSPGKSLSWRWQRLRFRLGKREIHEMRPGFTVACHPLAYRGAYCAQVDDPDQVAEYDCFIRHCSPNMVFFDVGAHFGLFALTALHYGGLAAMALAIDPSPVAVEMIGIQAALNGVGGRLQILRACACEHTGTRDMVAVGVQAAGYFVRPPADAGAGDRTLTRAVTLDSIVETTGLTPTHLKIDVESYEENVLRGGCNLLSSASAPLIFMELHNKMIRAQAKDPADVLGLLRDFGYRAYNLAGVAASPLTLLASDLVRFVAAK